MEQQSNQLPLELSSQLVTIMTTEHLNLQTARASAVAEANGRASLFVGAVSSGLVALALVGQLSHLDTAFFVFSLVVLPTLVLMGLITFERTLQAASVNLIYTSGLNRIRHLYLEYAPQMQPYFILSTHDDREGIVGQEGMHPSVVADLLQYRCHDRRDQQCAGRELCGPARCDCLASPCGSRRVWAVLTFLLSGALHQRYQWRQLRHRERNLPALFPSQPKL